MELGGYREHLVHQGEEGDYCIRLLASGYFVRVDAAAPIYHHESPNRNLRRMDYYGRRNDVLYVWHNVPLAALPAHMSGTVFNGLRAAVGAAHPLRMLRGTLAGLAGIIRYWKHRKPVSFGEYRLSRLLRKLRVLPMPSGKSTSGTKFSC